MSQRPTFWKPGPRRTHKYGAVKQEYSGYSFGSKLEASVFQQLKLREKAGEIRDIGVQVHVLICGPEGHECHHKQKIESVVDFRFTDVATGETQYAESKGFKTPDWKLKLRLWRHYRTEPLELWEGSWLRPVLVEVVKGSG